MWLTIIKLLMPFIIELIGNMEDNDECPDGICEAAEEQVKALQADLDAPRAAGFTDFLKCLDFPRFFAALTEIISVVRDALSGCPPMDETQD